MRKRKFSFSAGNVLRTTGLQKVNWIFLIFLKSVVYWLFSNGGRIHEFFFANKKTFRNGPISLRNFINVFNWVRRHFNLSNTQQRFQCRFNVLFWLIRRRNVRQRQINVETTLCISTLEFTTLNNMESMLCISTWC